MQGATVELQAAGHPGTQFQGWSGACSGSDVCAIQMDAAKNVTAAFVVTTGAHITATPLAGMAVQLALRLPMNLVEVCAWDFGDSNAAACWTGTQAARILQPTDQPFTALHTYAAAGTYTVSVTAGNDAGTFITSVPVKVEAIPRCRLPGAVGDQRLRWRWTMGAGTPCSLTPERERVSLYGY